MAVLGLRTMLLMVVLHISIAQDCQYSFLQQPPTQLTCNPHGSSLQLQCAVRGPTSPRFTIQWYTQSTSLGTLALEEDATPPIALPSSSHGYNVQSMAQDNVGLNERTASSVFIKNMITESDSLTCFWCELNILGYQPVRSNMLCVLAEADYAGFTSCGSSVVVAVNSSQTCVQPVPEHVKDSLSEMLKATPPTQPTHHTSSPQVQETPSPVSVKLSSSAPAESPDNSGSREVETENRGSRAKQMQALYVAIAFCAVFVVVIVLMVVVIMIMCRQKPCTKAVHYSQKYTSRDSVNGSGQVLRNAFNNFPDTNLHPVAPPTRLTLDIPHGFCQATSEPDLLRIQRCPVVDTGKSFGSGVLKKAVSYSDLDALPPRPLKAAGRGQPPQRHGDNYDHLKPTNHKKEHFYYTLERLLEPGDYISSTGDIQQYASCTSKGRQSPTYDQPNIQKDATDKGDYQEVVAQGNQNLSGLFDDPKYSVILLKARRKKNVSPVSISPPPMITQSQRPSYYPHSRSTENIPHVKGQQLQWPSATTVSANQYNPPLSTHSQPDLSHVATDHHRHHQHKRQHRDPALNLLPVPKRGHQT